MFSTDFIFRQQENLGDNQKSQAGFRPQFFSYSRPEQFWYVTKYHLYFNTEIGKQACFFLVSENIELEGFFTITNYLLQYTLDLRKPDLRKNLDLRKIVASTDFLVHKLFDLRKTF